MIRNERVRKMTRLAMLIALSVVLVLVVHIPYPPAPFLEYDPADIPILIATFIYGPWYGVLVTLVASLIQGVTVSSVSGIIGIVMHFVATSAVCLVAGYIYKSKKTMGSAVVALVAGTLVKTVVMVGCNYVLTPIFMGAPREQVVAMLLPIIVPFNLLKSGINSLVTFFVYKPISRLFAKKPSEKK